MDEMALMRFLLGLIFCFAAFMGPAVAQDTAPSDMRVTATESVETDIASQPSPAPDQDAVQQAFRRMKRDANAQWELRTDLPERPKPPGWADAVARFFGRLIEFLTPLFKVIFWVGLAIFGLIVLYAIFTSLRGIIQERGGETVEEIVPEYRPSAKAAQILLDDADALAAEGRYAEAIHLILYRSIQDIEKARPQAIRLSLTSREIARSDALGPQTRTIFAGIARFVERSHFGGRAVDAEDYANARGLYAQLATAPEPSKAESPITTGPALGAAS